MYNHYTGHDPLRKGCTDYDAIYVSLYFFGCQYEKRLTVSKTLDNGI